MKPMRSTTSFDYDHKDYFNRYMVEATRKRTGFQSLSGTDYTQFIPKDCESATSS